MSVLPIDHKRDNGDVAIYKIFVFFSEKKVVRINHVGALKWITEIWKLVLLKSYSVNRLNFIFIGLLHSLIFYFHPSSPKWSRAFWESSFQYCPKYTNHHFFSSFQFLSPPAEAVKKTLAASHCRHIELPISWLLRATLSGKICDVSISVMPLDLISRFEALSSSVLFRSSFSRLRFTSRKSFYLSSVLFLVSTKPPSYLTSTKENFSHVTNTLQKMCWHSAIVSLLGPVWDSRIPFSQIDCGSKGRRPASLNPNVHLHIVTESPYPLKISFQRAFPVSMCSSGSRLRIKTALLCIDLALRCLNGLNTETSRSCIRSEVCVGSGMKAIFAAELLADNGCLMRSHATIT